jgi:hypothetical protein
LQHVVDAEVNSVTAYTLNGASAATLSGANIPVLINSETDTLTFGGATIIAKDIYTSNGIIHVIDTVVIADVEIPDPLGSGGRRGGRERQFHDPRSSTPSNWSGLSIGQL